MRWIDKHLGEGVLSNATTLYGAYAVNYIVPLFAVPYLVRTLGPDSWGLVAVSQGLGNYLGLIVEYGFNLSATREVARLRQSPAHLSNVVAGVLGAKVLLASLALVVAWLLQRVLPGLREHSWILWAGVAAGITVGLSPLWYFQGCEQMKVVASLEVGAKVSAAAAVFVCVHSPADAWRVPGLQAVASLLSTGTGIILMCRQVVLRRFSVSLVKNALRNGWTLFLFKSSVMLYTAGNSFLLGLFAPPVSVGYFAGAEKISKAFMGLLNPFNQAVYPRLSRLAKHDPQAGVRLLRVNAIVATGGGLFLGALVFWLSPWLVTFLLGRAFSEAIPVLRLLSLLPPLIALNTVLSTQCMAPLGMDRLLNRIALAAGAVNVGFACLLAPHYRQIGMAIAVVIAELFISVTASYILLRQRATDVLSATPGVTLLGMEAE